MQQRKEKEKELEEEEEEKGKEIPCSTLITTLRTS